MSKKKDKINFLTEINMDTSLSGHHRAKLDRKQALMVPVSLALIQNDIYRILILTFLRPFLFRVPFTGKPNAACLPFIVLLSLSFIALHSTPLFEQHETLTYLCKARLAFKFPVCSAVNGDPKDKDQIFCLTEMI